MKKQNLYSIINIILLTICSFDLHAGQFTWTGSQDTVFTNKNNWSVLYSGANFPSSNDSMIVGTFTSNRPVLDQSRDVYYLRMMPGSQFDLKSYTFTVQNEAIFDGGTMSNGDMVVRGNLARFNGSSFTSDLDIEAGVIELSGGMFEGICQFKVNGNTISSGLGGCVFTDEVTLIQASSRTKWILAGTQSDTFNGTLKVYQESDSPIYLSNTDTTWYNGDIELSNTGSAPILFGEYDGLSFLASGKTIAVGDSGYAAGDLYVRQFYQDGNTVQNLTLTGTAGLFLKGVHFEAKTTLSAPGIVCDQSEFQDSVTIEKTGAESHHWFGNNDFYGNATISNTGSGSATDELRLSGVYGNRFHANTTFQSSGKALTVDFKDNTDFYGDVSINHSSIHFEKSVTFKGSNDQTLFGTTGYSFNDVTLDKTSGTVTPDTTMEVSGVFTFSSGYLVTDTINLLTMTATSSATGASDTSFVSGPVKKVGDTSFEFPVGKSMYFALVAISAPDSIFDSFLGEYFEFCQHFSDSVESGISCMSTHNYWKLNRLDGNSDVSLTLSWPSSIMQIVGEPEEVKIAHFDSLLWLLIPSDTLILTDEMFSISSLNTINTNGEFSITNMSAGFFHSSIVTSDGEVEVWGASALGQHGDCSTLYTAPSKTKQNSGSLNQANLCINNPPNLSNVIALASSGNHNLAVTCDNTVFAWGSNSNRQLGNVNYLPGMALSAIPVIYQNQPISDIGNVAAGPFSSFAISTSGQVYYWGALLSDLADGAPISSGSSVPVLLQSIPSPVTKVSCGTFHFLLLLNDGTVMSFGNNSSGQLGDLISTYPSTTTGVFVKTNATTYLSEIVDIAAGSNYNLALKKNGELFVWGSNGQGQLGLGSTIPDQEYAQLCSTLNPIKAIGTGTAHSIAVDVSDNVWTWGLNTDWQLGINGTTSPMFTPQLALLPSNATGIFKVIAGTKHTHVFTENGSIYGWGEDELNQLALPHSAPSIFCLPPPYYHPCYTLPVEISQQNGAFPVSEFSQCDHSVNYCYSFLEINAPNVQWLSSGVNQLACVFTPVITISDEVIIRKGAKLTIGSGVTVAFGPRGRLVLESGDANSSGGKLTIDNGARLTAVGDCMWKGIEVRGDASYQGTSARQAFVEFRPGAIIEHAHNAVTLGTFDNNYYSCYETTPSVNNPSGFDLSGSGGQIECDDATFQNNAIDIRFAPYDKLSASVIENSHFLGGPLRDTQYNSNNGLLRNIFYAVPNDQQMASIGVSQLGVKNVRISGNEFSDYQTALKLEDSRISIAGNTFEDCRLGIDSRTTISALSYGGLISSNIFSEIWRQVYARGGKYLTISDENQFNLIANPGSQTSNYFGIYLNNERAFAIYDNNFTSLKYGIVGVNSGFSGGIIGYQAQGNIFTDCWRSIQLQGSHPNLKIKCSTHDNGAGGTSYDTNWNLMGGTNLANQGFWIQGQTDEHTSAGNWYQPPNRKQLTSLSTIPFTYFRNGNTNTFTEIIPDPIGSITIDINVPILTDWEAACEPIFVPNNGEPDRLAYFSNTIDSLNQEIDTVISSVDHNLTDSLLAIVDDINPEDTIIARLLANGPLSDTVLIKAIQSPDALGDSALCLILYENSPYAVQVLSALNDRNPELNEKWRSRIDSVQGINPPFITVTGLTKERNYYKLEKTLVINDYVKRLTDQDSVTKAIAVLKAEGGYEDIQTVFGTYVLLGELDSAAAKLEQIQNMEGVETNWVDLSSILLNLASQGKTWFDMSGEQEQAIREIAESEGNSLAKIQAQNVLHQVFRDTFPDYVDEEEYFLRTGDGNSLMVDKVDNFNGLLIFPNPASDQVLIKSNTENNGARKVDLIDISGRIIYSEKVLITSGGLQIDVGKIDQGIYFINVSGNEIETKTGKLIIAR